jgi:hypothetical protein
MIVSTLYVLIESTPRSARLVLSRLMVELVRLALSRLLFSKVGASTVELLLVSFPMKLFFRLRNNPSNEDTTDEINAI